MNLSYKSEGAYYEVIRIFFQKVFHPIVMKEGRNHGISLIETKPIWWAQSVPKIKIGLTSKNLDYKLPMNPFFIEITNFWV
jgi:hypothetical protein